MTLHARVLIRMTGKTTALVDHGQLGVASVLERGQWDVAAWQFVVAPTAEVGYVAGGAALAVDSGVLAVNVISPPGSVRGGEHYLVTRVALLGRGRLRRHVGMANEAFCARCRRFRGVMLAEAFGMKVRLHVARMTYWGRARSIVDVADLAVRHAEFDRHRLRGLVTSHAVDHLRQRHAGQALTAGDPVVTGSALQLVLVSDFEMRGVGELQIDVLPCNYVRGNHAPLFGVSRILDFFRSVTAATVARR